MVEPMAFASREEAREIISRLLKPFAEHPDLDLELAKPQTPLARIRVVRDIVVAFAVDVEDAFSIVIDDEAIHHWKTVGCIFETVMAELAKEGREPRA